MSTTKQKGGPQPASLLQELPSLTVGLLTLPIRSRLRRRHALHRDRKSAVSALRYRDEFTIEPDRFKHRIDPSFHHLFRAHRLVALVLIEMTPQHLQRAIALPVLGKD